MKYERNSQEDLKETKNKQDEHAYFTHMYIYVYVDICVGDIEGDAYQKLKRGQR
jgi:hypothetical protein